MRLLALVALAVGLCGHPGGSSAQVPPNRESLTAESPATESQGSPTQRPLTQGSPTQGPPTQGPSAQPLAQRPSEDPLAQGRSEEAARSPEGALHKTVVELFTSQGCSSCPAADALLNRLAQHDDVIALSLPVDYWDYLGWKDTLANPKFSERQRAYARTRGDGAIYTPQLVVNGVAHVNGSDEGQIARAIDKTEKALASVPVQLHEEEGKLIVEAGSLPRGVAGKDATIWLAVIARRIEVPIQRGENQGKTITYYNVVRELIPVGKWSGKPVTIELARASLVRPGAESCAVLLQLGQTGPIMGAALMKEF
jgi:hypothetical protein